MTKYAFASMTYHKRMTGIYILLLIVTGSVIFLSNSLAQLIPVIREQIANFLSMAGYQEEQQTILQQIEEPSRQLLNVYHQIRMVGCTSLIAFLFVFFTLCQRKKEAELSSWYHSGSSISGWVRLNLIEALLGFGFVLLFFIVGLIIFQKQIANLVLMVHMQITDHFFGSAINIQLLEDTNLERFLIRFPTTNAAFFRTLNITDREWLRIMGNAFWQTAYGLFVTIVAINLPTSSIYSLWRYHRWNHPSVD